MGKLETDPQLLIPKSRAALSRYGHQLVIGNDLHRRKLEVVFVERKNASQQSHLTTPKKGSGNPKLKGVETPPVMDVDLPEVEEYEETWLRLDQLRSANGGNGQNGGTGGEVEIEELIIKELVLRHTKWIEAGSG